MVVSAQRCYAGDQGPKPRVGGHDGQSKPWSHPAKGVKIGTSPMWEDMRSPTV